MLPDSFYQCGRGRFFVFSLRTAMYSYGLAGSRVPEHRFLPAHRNTLQFGGKIRTNGRDHIDKNYLVTSSDVLSFIFLAHVLIRCLEKKPS